MQAERVAFWWERSAVFLYIERCLSAIETSLNIISVSFIMFIMFFASSEIIGRYFFNHPIPGHVEIVELSMAAVVFLGMAYTQRVKGHIGFDLVIDNLKGRAYYIASIITSVLSLFVYIIITISSFQFALDAYRVGDVTGYIYWYTWPSKLCVPIGGFFLCIRFAIEIILHTSCAIIGIEHRKLQATDTIIE